MTNFKVELLLPEDIAVSCLRSVKYSVQQSIRFYSEKEPLDVERIISYLTVIKQIEDLSEQIKSAIPETPESTQLDKDELNEVVDAF